MSRGVIFFFPDFCGLLVGLACSFLFLCGGVLFWVASSWDHLRLSLRSFVSKPC